MSKKNKKQQAEPQEQDQGNEAESQEQVHEPKIDLAAMLADMTDKYQRLGADYQNYQKRAERQINQASEFAKESIVKALLPVLDNMDHTMEKGHTSNNIAELMQAVQIVFDHFKNTLEGQGLKTIAVKAGAEFDPACHEAMLHEENSEVAANAIVRELAKGYTMNDRTLRPARVSVAKAPVEPVEDNPEVEQGGE